MGRIKTNRIKRASNAPELSHTLILAALLAGCATRPPVSDADAARFSAIVAEFAAPAMEGRGIGTAGLLRAEHRLIDEFARLRLTPAFRAGYAQPFDIDVAGSTHRVANVAAMVPGAGDLRDEVVVIAAHYDHLGFGQLHGLSAQPRLHPGADDNASGIAALLMLADRLTLASPPAPQPEARRTLLLCAFTAEEVGQRGAAHLLDHLDDLAMQRPKLVAMINMDMVGRMAGRKLHVIDADSGRGWHQPIRNAARHAGLHIDHDPFIIGKADHRPFLDHHIPAMLLFTGLHPDYHRPGDTADKINAEGGARVVAFVHHLVQALRTNAAKPAFVRGFGG